MTGLASLFGAHRRDWDGDCICSEYVLEVSYEEHLAAAVIAWLTERLANEEVREAVVRALYPNDHEKPAYPGDLRGQTAEAALAAVTTALAGDDEAGMVPEAAKTAPVSDLGPESGQGDHRDDEGRSGAQGEGK